MRRRGATRMHEASTGVGSKRVAQDDIYALSDRSSFCRPRSTDTADLQQQEARARPAFKIPRELRNDAREDAS